MPPVQKPTHPRRRHFLREWRAYRHLSQEALASRLEIDRATLSRIERGLVPYSQDMLEKAADALRCEPADLIMRDPTREDAPWSIYESLKRAPEKDRAKVAAVVEALLRTGT